MVEAIRVVVADDEAVARRRLVRLLEETGEAVVVAACSGGRETIERVAALEPQLLFLDVQMPDLDGFGVIEALGNRVPAIVFVTAFDRYALRAFDVHAVDYLLKPFDTARFRAAFARARDRASTRPPVDDARLREALASFALSRAETPSRFLDRIAVRTDGALKIVRTSDVDWLEADGNYVRLHVGAAQHLIRATIGGLECRLDSQAFIRTHRRYIVNVDRIMEVQPWFAGHSVVVLRGGAKLGVSRTFRARLHERLGARSAHDDDRA